MPARRLLIPALAFCLVVGLATVVSTATPASASTSSGQVPAFLHCGNNIFPSSKSRNLYSPDFVGQLRDLTFLPLAFQSPQGLASFIPQVAVSWAPGKHSLTVHLRQNMLWQNGAPVTSTDVVDTVLLDGVDASGIWGAITAVRASGAHTVVFALAPDVALSYAETLILETTPVPAAQYGRFVTPELAKDVPAYEADVRSNPAAAAASPLGHTIAADLTALERFDPSTLIGDGPFRLDSWTEDRARLSKSPTFFDAKLVRVKEWIQQDTDQAVDEGAIMGGSCDQSLSGMPESIYQKDATIPGHHVYYKTTYDQKALLLNDRHYPLNLTKVRQALAYIIHRKSLITLTFGTNMTFRFEKHPSLLYYANELNYITKGQLASLNSYPYNPKKATQLLESANFKKVHGTWYLPDGKPFTLTDDFVSVYPNWITNADTIDSWLSAFGIKTKGYPLSSATDFGDIQDGNFELAQDEAWDDVNPFQAFEDFLGTSLNFTSKTEPGIGFGPMENVPGIGRVDVSTALQKDLVSYSYGPAMKKVVWDWARFINTQMPFIVYGGRDYGIMFSTLHYTWPRKASPLWTLTAYNTYAGIDVMLERGYIVPR